MSKTLEKEMMTDEFREAGHTLTENLSRMRSASRLLSQRLLIDVAAKAITVAVYVEASSRKQTPEDRLESELQAAEMTVATMQLLHVISYVRIAEVSGLLRPDMSTDEIMTVMRPLLGADLSSTATVAVGNALKN